MDLPMKVMLETVFALNIINTPSHPMLLKRLEFVKHVDIYTFLLFIFETFVVHVVLKLCLYIYILLCEIV